MRKLAILLLIFGSTLAPVVADSDADIQKTGEAWLALIDNQQYTESWTQASTLFRGQVPQGQWVSMIKSARGPLGAVLSRQRQSLMSARSLPGAPDGEYTVIQFKSSFRHKITATETLTLMKDGGTWRSAGYYIR